MKLPAHDVPMGSTYLEIDGAYSSFFVQAGVASDSVVIVVTRLRRLQGSLGIPPQLSIDFSDVSEVGVERHRLAVRTRLVYRAGVVGSNQTVWLSRWVGEQLQAQFPGRWSDQP